VAVLGLAGSAAAALTPHVFKLSKVAAAAYESCQRRVLRNKVFDVTAAGREICHTRQLTFSKHL
jgi:hypothetical protein